MKLSFYDLCSKHFLSFLNYKDQGAAAVYENLQNSMNKIFAELLASTGDHNPRPPPTPKSEEERRMKAMEELIALYSSEKEELKRQVDSLESENKQLLDHMVRHSKASAGGERAPFR